MPFVLKDRVKETTTSTGTGTITLAGAAVGYQSFSVIGNGNNTYYTIAGGSQWEVGIGTYTSSGTTLSRDTVLESSNSNALVNFSAGTKEVFVTYPAEIAGFLNIPLSGSAKTGSYTLATTDVGRYIEISTGGSIVIPTSTFAAGDVVSLVNNTTGNITITCSAPTAYIAGTNTVKTSMTLATRGVATVLFISATVCIVTGNVT